jgi:hypothetical protein
VGVTHVLKPGKKILLNRLETRVVDKLLNAESAHKTNCKAREKTLRFLSSKIGITKIMVGILVFVIALAVAGASYYIATRPVEPKPTPTPTPTITPTPTTAITPTPTASVNPTPAPTPTSSDLTTPEKVRNSVMTFMRVNHAETAQFMTDLIWTGGRVTPQNLVGAETYMYYSQGWNVTITYPVVPNAIYTIKADYSATSIGIPYRVIWQGTWQSEVINETNYIFAQ